MSYKLDVGEVQAAIERRDFEYLDRKTEEQRKGFAAPVMMRFASALAGGGDFADLKLLLVNERANVNFYDIHQHPELQYRLLASCGIGTGRRSLWIDMPKRKISASGVHKFLSKYWPDANADELNILLGQFTRETFHEFVHGCGLEPKAASEIVEAYDKLMGFKTSGSKKKAKPKS
jgi:hypothetical protein